ncbi:transposase [Streptomyces spongiae]|uniref:Transposase family protein n=1 Tax=Streptomyces spongiae TaxID=565072 RepID=A0A5N8XK60_9ACTN|nr:transposase [Streptomyces spongiae]MPY59839.1 transposase family protein [Streptomyces spongiae]
MQRELLDLAAGGGVRLNGVEWTVEAVEPQLGRIVLRDGAGERQRRPIRWLMHHPDCHPSGVSATSEGGSCQLAEKTDLTESQLERARLRAAHMLEAQTGYRGGHPSWALPGEPRPAYDPERTTLAQRRRAKAEELKALGPEEAAVLGVDRMSERTLRRLATASSEDIVAGCADGRWTRRSGGHPSITEEIREAIFAVRRESLLRSRISMRAKHRLLHQYVRETFPLFPLEKVPCCNTLRTVWRQWFGPDGARQCYARSADAARDASQRVVVHRPGQVVALDTTPLPVKVRESVFGEPVSAMLTLALDLFTHSIVAFRLTLVSDTSVDIAMLLRDVMLPLPMREGWGEDMEWPYPGVPATVVAQFAGHRVAALPFFAPETVTTDHGSPYKNHHVVEAERTLGCNMLPARTLRPTDKFVVERAFAAINSLLLEHLLGFTGADVADRGADPEADAVLSMSQTEHLIATWVVKIWQNRILGEYAPAWGPGEDHSPNSLFAAAMQQGGFALQIPRPELYYRLLKAHYVRIHPRRGVKIGGLWYHAPVLDDPRFHLPSARGGRHKGKWLIRSDRRDRRTVFFQDDVEPDRWHVLSWTGLPRESEIPAFSDRGAETLLAEVRRRGLAPRSDAELLPIVLELLGSAIPVAQWPTQMTKRERSRRSRQHAQAEAVAVDRAPATASGRDGDADVLAWPDQARTIQESVDADRRRRREAATAGRRPTPPPRLGETLRRRTLFLLPPDEDEAEAVARPEERR